MIALGKISSPAVRTREAAMRAYQGELSVAEQWTMPPVSLAVATMTAPALMSRTETQSTPTGMLANFCH